MTIQPAVRAGTYLYGSYGCAMSRYLSVALTQFRANVVTNAGTNAVLGLALAFWAVNGAALT